MPTLNSYILIDLAKEILTKYRSREKACMLKKFMLSGKEPFAATLKCFAVVKSLRLHTGHFHAIGENGFDVTLPYVFELLDPIIKVLEKCVTSLDVYNCPMHPRGVKIMDTLILSKRVKEVRLGERLPPSKMAWFQTYTLDVLELYKIYLYYHENDVYNDIFAIPAKTHLINCGLFAYKEIPLNGVWENVTNLRIENALVDKFGFLKFIGNLPKKFPNLQTIDAQFLYDQILEGSEEEEIFYDDDMTTDLKDKLQSQLFSGMPSTLKGKISCSTLWVHTEKKERFLQGLGLDIHLDVATKLINLTDELIIEICVS